MNIWEKIQAVDKRWLFLILVICASAGLFIPAEVPAKADVSSIALYQNYMALDPNKPMLIQSDWTNSTRGENLGHLESLLRVIMARKQKFVIFSLADPQAPQVARDALVFLNEERKKNGLEPYQKGKDYLDLGYFPNAEGSTQSMGSNLKKHWTGRRTRTPDQGEIDIFDSPVLKGVKKIEDCAGIVYITASNTIDTGIQRLSGKVKIFCMCTGVVGPQILPYFQSGQVAGLAVGLKGVYDMELMMNYGVNVKDDKGVAKVETPAGDVTPVLDSKVKFGRGKQYYAALNVVLGLLVIAVIVGNVTMLLAKKAAGGNANGA